MILSILTLGTAQTVTDDSISGDREVVDNTAAHPTACSGEKVALPPAQFHLPALGSLPHPPASSLAGGQELSPSDYPPGWYLPIRISPETSPCPFPFPQPPQRCSLVCGKRRVHPGTPLPWGDLAPSEGQTSVTAASPDSNPGPDKSLNPGACLPICYSGIARVPHLPGLLKGKSVVKCMTRFPFWDIKRL